MESIEWIDHATTSVAGRACRAFQDAGQNSRRHDHHAIDQLDLALHTHWLLQRRNQRSVIREASSTQLQKGDIGLKSRSIAGPYVGGRL